jgi:membrane associated rhomboid family serine protease
MSPYIIFPCCRRRGSSGNIINSRFSSLVFVPFCKVLSLLFVIPFLTSFLYHHIAYTRGCLVVVTKNTNDDNAGSSFIASLYGRHQQQQPPGWMNFISNNNDNNDNIQEYHPPIFSWTSSDLQWQPLVDIYTASKILSSKKYSSAPPLIIRKLEPQQAQPQSTPSSWCISLHDSSDDDEQWCKTRSSSSSSSSNNNNDNDKNDDSIHGKYYLQSETKRSFHTNNITASAEVVTTGAQPGGMTTMIVQDASSMFGPRLQSSLIPLRRLSRLLFASWTSATANNNQIKVSKSSRIPDNGAIAAADSSSSSSSTLFRRNPNRQTSSSTSDDRTSGWKQLLSRPAFILLTTLQLALAWLYWERNVPVMNVAMYYPQMTITTTPTTPTTSLNSNSNNLVVPQVWRALSGSTAHFNLWHLGLNIMSFHQLSLDIEQSSADTLFSSSSSIVYFMTNLSFIAIIAAVWMLLQHGKERFQQYYRNQRQQQHELQMDHSPTVGYSGVLFAWSVVATTLLRGGQQYESCPIPFLDQFCFGTHYLLGNKRFPFSWAPLVQLALAQVMLPNVSWTGHLAGIMVGYAWAWNMLALPWLASHVELTWPTLHLLSILLAMRRYHHHQSQQQQEQQRESSTPFLEQLQPWRVLSMSLFSSLSRFVRSTCIIGKMHTTVALLTVLVWGPLHALTLSTALVFSCWYALERQQAQAAPVFTQHNRTTNNSKQNDDIFVGALMRCYMVAVVLNLVNTSMTVGLWWSMPSIWILHQSPIALLLVPLQCMTLLLGLFRVASAAIANKETTNTVDFQTGIFYYTLGITLLQPMTETTQRLHQWLQHVQSSPPQPSQQQCCLERFLSTCLTNIDGMADPHADSAAADGDSHCFHSNARNRNGTNSCSISRHGSGGHVAFSGVGQRLGGGATSGTNRESDMV